MAAREPELVTRPDFPSMTVSGGVTASRVEENSYGPLPPLPAIPPIPDAFALLKALRHRWLLALTIGLLCSAAAAGVTWYLLPATLSLVTATAKLYIKSNDIPPPFWVASDRTDWNTFRKTQCELIKTRPILEASLERPEAAPYRGPSPARTLAFLERTLKVGPDDGSEVVEISLTGENPAQVAALVNAVTHTYLDDYLRTEREQRQARLDHYEQIKRENEDFIHRQLAEIHRLKGSFVTDGQAGNLENKITLEGFTALQKEYQDLSAKIEKAELQLQFEREKKKTGVAPKVPHYLVEEQLEKDQDFHRLVGERSRLLNIIEGYRSYAADGPNASPLVRSSLSGYESDLKSLDRQIEARRRALLPRIEQQLRQTKPDPRDVTVAQLEDDVKLWKAEQARLGQRYEAQKQKVEKFFGRPPAALDTILKEIERKQEIAKSFSMEVEALRVQMSNPPRVRLIQDAVEPEPRDANRQTKTIILAAVGAFLFVGFCTAWLEYRSRRIHSSDEIVSGLGMRLLGTLPALPQRLRLHPLGGDETRDARLHDRLTESIDGIRTMLLHDSRRTRLQTLMVTSGVSGEGKTTFSSQLAISYAQAGRRTLLIDCDLMRPRANQLFERPLEPGLCEVLRGEARPADVLTDTPLPGLTLLPAGRFNRHVSHALAKGGMQQVLDELRPDFDVIILDSCPVLSVSNTLLIGQAVDAVILSVLRDVSQSPRVYAAHQRLTTLGIRVLGAVFNKAGQEPYGYGYYGYYGYRPQSAPESQAKA